MPPEVIMQRGLSRYSDIWSVGCVVIEMAAGKPPWSGANQVYFTLVSFGAQVIVLDGNDVPDRKSKDSASISFRPLS